MMFEVNVVVMMLVKIVSDEGGGDEGCGEGSEEGGGYDGGGEGCSDDDDGDCGGEGSDEGVVLRMVVRWND